MTFAMFSVMLLLTIACARMAQQMAAYQNRSVRLWMWAGAMAGPVAPLLLAALPRIRR